MVKFLKRLQCEAPTPVLRDQVRISLSSCLSTRDSRCSSHRTWGGVPSGPCSCSTLATPRWWFAQDGLWWFAHGWSGQTTTTRKLGNLCSLLRTSEKLWTGCSEPPGVRFVSFFIFYFEKKSLGKPPHLNLARFQIWPEFNIWPEFKKSQNRLFAQ